MIIDIVGIVDQGHRESNDDRAMLCDKILESSMYSGTTTVPFVAAVCDGCGGYFGGALAAETVLKKLSEKSPLELIEIDCLSETLEESNRQISILKKQDPKYDRMCTTVAGCVFGENQILIFHAGDSRVYRYDGMSLARMTTDHSKVQEMIENGVITEEEAEQMSERNIITRCMGIEGLFPEIYVSHSSLEEREIYLICSDGVWSVLNDKKLLEILSSDESLEQKANDLIKIALAEGSQDNLSVCLCGRKGKAISWQEEESFVLD